jgi:RHS repeat-associated protein
VQWSNGATNITMKFDRMGRRVEYIEAVGNATNTHHRFVYDGYLCIQRLDAAANNAIDLIFAWDPAESVATRPLMIEKHGKCMLYVTHDGNKNVSDLLFFNGGSGVAAHYEYAPFGALTASTRNSTSTAYDFRTYNPFRFSSEYADDALGLVYYNYRHYEPVMGRWLQRDRCVLTPLNPYLFLVNRASGIDCLGKYDEWVHYYLMYLLMREYGYDESAAKTMAEGSQYPDGESLWASLFLVQFDAMYIPNLITFQTKYQETLHNLNGLGVGKLEKYQCCIREAINSITKGENLKEMDYFKVGVLVHALGDTYAHFKLVKGSDGKSYGPMIGHFEDGKKPDDPHNNIERFRKYLQELERLIPHNQNYRLDDHIYGYMSNRAWIYWDKDGYYSPPKVLSYKEQIKLLYGEKHLRFETMTVERTDQRDDVVKKLVVQIKECLERARGK